jgi:N6-L-threonylcarbamoyladenine synthase
MKARTVRGNVRTGAHEFGKAFNSITIAYVQAHPVYCGGSAAGNPAMLILGIETSCDETGIALLDTETQALHHVLHTQMAMHADYGGVVPELASRDHILRVVPLLESVLREAGRELRDIDLIACTVGPGLPGALLVGTSTAAGLAFALGKPVLPIHHLEGHLLSPMLDSLAPTFPFTALLVSGGHTQLMAVEAVGNYRLLGETIDDAAGEAFDKTATLLGLAYPGGPALAKLAEAGQGERFRLPRPLLKGGDLDFSFSGLKTAVLTLVRTLEREGRFDTTARADVAAGFQAAVVEVLTEKCVAALARTGHTTLIVAGGVGANTQLRTQLEARVRARQAHVYFPPLRFCTDNGAMIAKAAELRLKACAMDFTAAGAFAPGAFAVRSRWPLTG